MWGRRGKFVIIFDLSATLARFTPRDWARGTQRIGSWMGTGADLDAEIKIKNSSPCRGSNTFITYSRKQKYLFSAVCFSDLPFRIYGINDKNQRTCLKHFRYFTSFGALSLRPTRVYKILYLNSPKALKKHDRWTGTWELVGSGRCIVIVRWSSRLSGESHVECLVLTRVSEKTALPTLKMASAMFNTKYSTRLTPEGRI